MNAEPSGGSDSTVEPNALSSSGTEDSAESSDTTGTSTTRPGDPDTEGDSTTADPSPPTIFELPPTVDLGGSATAVAIADLDTDGFLDLVGFAVDESSAVATLVVAWGAVDPYAERYERPIVGAHYAVARDSATEVVQLVDLDGDGTLDVVTASGVAFGRPNRAFAFEAWSGEADHAVAPVAVLPPYIWRGGPDGTVDRCDNRSGCTPIGGIDCTGVCPIEEIGLVDLDADGTLDLLAGGRFGQHELVIWYGRRSPGIGHPEPHAVDWEFADLDLDTQIDLVAQVEETIADFPSYTEVWRAGEHDPALARAQSFLNQDNHNDAMEVADVDGDGCADLLHVGVDTSTVWVRRGVSEPGGGCTGVFDEGGWESAPGLPGATGIQQLDANGDGEPEWWLRAPPLDDATGHARLHVLEPSLM